VKNDKDKLDWSLIPSWDTLEKVIEVLQYGAKKYSREGWKAVEHQRYVTALVRHTVAYAKGERTDPEDGLPTLAHIICNAMFLDYKDCDDGEVRYIDIDTGEIQIREGELSTR
jgi:hypothetical protein